MQVLQGKAFEYACLNSIHQQLSALGDPVSIVQSPALQTAQNAYGRLNNQTRIEMDLAAQAGTDLLLKLEPNLYGDKLMSTLMLEIQADSAGQQGDVRDLRIYRDNPRWEIGISAKHNHSALKHSRLSMNIDFGKRWLGIHCSAEYFDSIRPIFDKLDQLRDQGALWGDLPGKMDDFYVPLLNNFRDELLRLWNGHGATVPRELLRYLIGKHDFYKVIGYTREQRTEVQAFSLNETLNKAAPGRSPALKVRSLHLPTQIHDISFKPNSKTTLHITLDQGWQISARIHSASSRVEPSLKFDIGFVGQNSNLFATSALWVGD